MTVSPLLPPGEPDPLGFGAIGPMHPDPGTSHGPRPAKPRFSGGASGASAGPAATSPGAKRARAGPDTSKPVRAGSPESTQTPLGSKRRGPAAPPGGGGGGG